MHIYSHIELLDNWDKFISVFILFGSHCVLLLLVVIYRDDTYNVIH